MGWPVREASHVVRFTKGSRALKLKAGEYVRVIGIVLNEI